MYLPPSKHLNRLLLTLASNNVAASFCPFSPSEIFLRLLLTLVYRIDVQYEINVQVGKF